MISTALALLAYRRRWVERPVLVVTAILYTIPSLALFELLAPLPGFGLSRTDRRGGARLLHAADPVPQHAHRPARGPERGPRRRPRDGHGPTQSLLRVELPLALPAIIAGLRIATVTVISLATVASLIDNEGLGVPILTAISNEVFKTELIAAGALAVALALAADGLLVIAAAGR